MKCLFGSISTGANGCCPQTDTADIMSVQLNAFGRIVDAELKKSLIVRKEVTLDQYVIMPNHVHCITIITQKKGVASRQTEGRQRQLSAPTVPNRKRTLSSFVQGFKTAVTVRINELRSMPGEPVWQRSFYDHVIRNEQALDAIREYLANNPANWKEDIYHPDYSKRTT